MFLQNGQYDCQASRESFKQIGRLASLKMVNF